ncbi:unnamed protein product [Symbiodinium sp. CCMP2592]|nr:unnamed protein product [Symbiodinium sp. CCMP2592]
MFPCLRKALVLNTNALYVLVQMWVARYDYETTQKAKTPPLAAIHDEVKKFWVLIGGNKDGVQPTAVQVHAEAWGLRKLISYSIRRVSMGHRARDPSVRDIFHVFIRGWFPEVLHEWENADASEDLEESDHMSDEPDVDPDAPRVKVEEDDHDERNSVSLDIDLWSRDEEDPANPVAEPVGPSTSMNEEEATEPVGPPHTSTSRDEEEAATDPVGPPPTSTGGVVDPSMMDTLVNTPSPSPPQKALVPSRPREDLDAQILEMERQIAARRAGHSTSAEAVQEPAQVRPPAPVLRQNAKECLQELPTTVQNQVVARMDISDESGDEKGQAAVPSLANGDYKGFSELPKAGTVDESAKDVPFLTRREQMESMEAEREKDDSHRGPKAPKGGRGRGGRGRGGRGRGGRGRKQEDRDDGEVDGEGDDDHSEPEAKPPNTKPAKADKPMPVLKRPAARCAVRNDFEQGYLDVYWTRPACGLKLRTTGKSVFYLAQRGATMAQILPVVYPVAQILDEVAGDVSHERFTAAADEAKMPYVRDWASMPDMVCWWTTTSGHVLITAVLLLIWSHSLPEKYDVVEYFGGLALMAALQGKYGATYRSFLNPMGYTGHRSVRVANLISCRTILLLLLIEAKCGIWLVEQPNSSLLFESDRFRWFVHHLDSMNMRVFKQKFYMKFFGHPNPKPTLVVANSPKIILLQHPAMKLADLKCEKKTIYPMRFALRCLEIQQEARSDGRDPAPVDLRTDLRDMYAGLAWGDVWDDAAMAELLIYLRGSTLGGAPSEGRLLASEVRLSASGPVKVECPDEDQELAAMEMQLEELRKRRRMQRSPEAPSPGTTAMIPPGAKQSETTPMKVNKKQALGLETVQETQVDQPVPSPSPAKIDTPQVKKNLFAQSPGSGGTGEPGDSSAADVEELRHMIERMQIAMDAKDVENRNLQEQLKSAAEMQGQAQDDEKADDALRKRLQRLCERKKNGSLNVPKEIHDLWMKGGEDRAELRRRLKDANLDKEVFIKSVKVLLKQREAVKYRVKAQWCSEDKMRDTLKLKEARIKAVKEFCEARPGYTTYDKYQKLTKYWYEEDLEMDWEKERSRETNEEGEYETTTDAASFLDAPPIEADLNQAARGTPSRILHRQKLL